MHYSKTLLIDDASELERPIDFMIVGAQKAGTTALFESLRAHPQIDMAEEKELHFFDNDELFGSERMGADGMGAEAFVAGSYGAKLPQLHAYHERFPKVRANALRGEATPIYMYWAPAMQRLWQYSPWLRLIVLLRSPIERAYSHWQMETQRCQETLDFVTAIREERERSRSALPSQHRIFSYADRGFYCEQLRRIWRYFPPEQTLVLRSDELRLTPKLVLSRVFHFLGVEDSSNLCVAEACFEGNYAGPMSVEARELLCELFEFEIKQLERLLGWELSEWLPKREA